MAEIDITRTELIWPGKYNEDGTLKQVPRVSLPFQVIETVNESRATREAKKGPQQTTLFDVYEGKEGDTFEDGWRNKLIWGDNLLVMGSLLEKFAGKIDLIYIDPPFATGSDFSFTTEIGDSGEEVTKEQSVIEEKAYRDTWGAGLGSYAAMLTNRLRIMRDLLSDRGSIYIHCDYRTSALIRVTLDDLFGSDNYRSTLIWKKDAVGKGGKKKARHWPRTFDEIFFFTKSSSYHYSPQLAELADKQLKEFRYQDEDGRSFKRTTLGNYTDESIAAMQREGLIYTSSSGQQYKKYYLDEYTL